MKQGQAAEATRTFGAADLEAYRQLGGPSAPPGLVPEPLVGALFSYLLGVHLPGPGANYLKQDSTYLRAPRLDEVVTARVEIVRIRPDKQLVDLSTVCRGQDGEVICVGRALIHVDDLVRP